VRPLAQSDGHDSPGLIDELVPSLAAVVDEIVVGFKGRPGVPSRRLVWPPGVELASSRRTARRPLSASLGRVADPHRNLLAAILPKANLPSFATPTWRLKARYELAKSKLELNTACAFAGWPQVEVAPERVR
jgi:hypothetical protein